MTLEFDLDSADTEDIWWSEVFAIVSVLFALGCPLLVGSIILLLYPPPPWSDDAYDQDNVIHRGDLYKEKYWFCYKAHLPRTMILTEEHIHLMIDGTIEETFNVSTFDRIETHGRNAPFKFELASSTNTNKIILIVNTRNELENWVNHIQNEIHKNK
eukprot:49851_1